MGFHGLLLLNNDKSNFSKFFPCLSLLPAASWAQLSYTGQTYVRAFKTWPWRGERMAAQTTTLGSLFSAECTIVATISWFRRKVHAARILDTSVWQLDKIPLPAHGICPLIHGPKLSEYKCKCYLIVTILESRPHGLENCGQRQFRSKVGRCDFGAFVQHLSWEIFSPSISHTLDSGGHV